MAIVMGAIGLLTCGLYYLVGGIGASTTITLPDGTSVAPNEDLATVGFIFGSITIVASASLAFSGAGALLHVPNWRNWAISAAVFILMLAVTRFVVQIAYVGPKAEQATKAMKEETDKKGKPADCPMPRNMPTFTAADRSRQAFSNLCWSR